MGTGRWRFGILLGVIIAAVGLGAVEIPESLAQEPIRIGFLYPDTGPFAQPGFDKRDGFLLYWSEVGNKAGGRPVQVLLEGKGTNKPDEGLTKARKLVERDRVHMLGGITATPVAYALRTYVIEKSIPTIIMTAGADDLTKKLRNPYIFRISFSNSDSSHPLGEWAYRQGYRKAVIIALDYAAGYEQIGGFARTFIDAGGQVIRELYAPIGTPDYAPYPTQIRRDASFARAMAVEPSILLLDETFNQLGEVTSQSLRREFLGVVHSTGTTCVLVTHRIEEALEAADRVLVFGKPASVLREMPVSNTERTDPAQLALLRAEIQREMKRFETATA